MIMDMGSISMGADDICKLALGESLGEFVANAVKSLMGLVIAMVLILCLQTIVFASNPEPVLTVNTSLNVEPPVQEDEYAPQEIYGNAVQEVAWVWHPIGVVNEPMNGFNAVRRTYALPPDVNPSVISTSDFEMFGQRFSFAYVLQQQTLDESFIEVRETVTIDARSRNLNDILPNLENEIWYERDGFAGTLVLDIHSITSEVAGTTRNTSTATRHRTFPHLSSPDNSLIPRTITDGGTTFHLSTVEWTSGSVSTVDGHPVASNHTAHATFTAQVTQTRNTGYTVTAEYVGKVFRTTQGKTLFTAIFYGEPIIEIWLDEVEYAPEIEAVTVLPAEKETTTASASVPYRQEETYVNAGGGIVATILTIAGVLAGIGALGAGGYFLVKHYAGYNVTVFSIDGPSEIIKAGKIKMDASSLEPIIMLRGAVGQNLAKTDRYIIQISKRAISKLIDKDVRVMLYDKEATHSIPDTAMDMSVYEFEVNFSDE